jgi:hypothetical protein
MVLGISENEKIFQNRRNRCREKRCGHGARSERRKDRLKAEKKLKNLMVLNYDGKA